MEVFHKRTSFLIYDAAVRLRQGYGGTDFLRSLRIRFTLVNPPAVRGMACPDVKKAVRFSDGFGKSGGVWTLKTNSL